MATFYSNVAAKQTETNAGKLLPVDFGGRVRVIHGGYTATGTEKDGDKFVLCRLPKGARILPLTQILCSDESAWKSISFGNSYAMSHPANKVGSDPAYFQYSMNGYLADFDNKAADEQDVILEFGITPEIGYKMIFDIFYVID